MEATSTPADELDLADPRATMGTSWQFIADRVMGGVSSGTLRRETVLERSALRMRGEVSLENNGGFIQMALDLGPDGGSIDASGWAGIEVDVIGNDEHYNLHLRTLDVVRPWQSYRAIFTATGAWRTLRLPFNQFMPHRLEVPLDLRHLRRVGFAAIGRAFRADLAVSGLRFYR